MQRAIRASQPFDGGDRVPFRLRGQGQARQHRLAVDMDGAGAALLVIAPFLGAREAKLFAQRIQQGGPVVERHPMRAAIDLQREGAARHIGRWRRGFSGSGADASCADRKRQHGRGPGQELTPVERA